MASLVVRYARRDHDPDLQPVVRGLRAAPHRGTDVITGTLGDVAVGVANDDGPAVASLDADDEMLVAIAGRLDEADHLAKELLDDGRSVEIGNEASIVRGLFQRDGDRAVERLRGIFEGMVTDGRRVWCFRDQLGLRPMFYRETPDAFVAATEAKQVAAAAGLATEPDLDVVGEILFGDVDDRTPSALRGIERLRKSTLLSADADGIRARA